MADFQTAKVNWYKYNKPFERMGTWRVDAIDCAAEIETMEQKGVFDVFPDSRFFTWIRSEAKRYRDKYWYGVPYDGDEEEFLGECKKLYDWANDFFGR